MAIRDANLVAPSLKSLLIGWGSVIMALATIGAIVSFLGVSVTGAEELTGFAGAVVLLLYGAVASVTIAACNWLVLLVGLAIWKTVRRLKPKAAQDSSPAREKS